MLSGAFLREHSKKFISLTTSVLPFCKIKPPETIFDLVVNALITQKQFFEVGDIERIAAIVIIFLQFLKNTRIEFNEKHHDKYI